MRWNDHELSNSNRRSSREGNAGKVVDSLHDVASDSNLMDRNESNREGDGEKRTGRRPRRGKSYNFGMRNDATSDQCAPSFGTPPHRFQKNSTSLTTR
jgi:hypothetical protein